MIRILSIAVEDIRWYIQFQLIFWFSEKKLRIEHSCRTQHVYKGQDDNVVDPTFGRGMHTVHKDQTSIGTRISQARQGLISVLPAAELATSLNVSKELDLALAASPESSFMHAPLLIFLVYGVSESQTTI